FADRVELNLVFEVYRLLASLDTPAPIAGRRRIAALASRVEPPPGDPDSYLRDGPGRWVPPGASWPDGFFAAVVSATTAEFVLLAPKDGIDLARGVAASCAAPGIVAPVVVNDTPMMDGGARSATDAD